LGKGRHHREKKKVLLRSQGVTRFGTSGFLNNRVQIVQYLSGKGQQTLTWQIGEGKGQNNIFYELGGSE